MRLLIGVQARTNSKRLPAKIHEKIGDFTILEHVVRAAQRADAMSNAIEYIVAVLGPTGDIRLKEECKRIEVDCLLFDKEDDVLGRYVQACEKYQANAVIRLTADCVDIQTFIIEECAKGLTEADYCSNTIIRSYREGWDCQGCSRKALKWFDVKSIEREHVFSEFEANEKVRKDFIDFGYTLRHILNKDNELLKKTSIDTKEDLERARQMYGNELAR